MNKLINIFLVSCLIVIPAHSQNLFEEIEQTYQKIDSANYVDKVFLKQCQLFFNQYEELKGCVEYNRDRVKNTTTCFLLNIDIDSAKVSTDNFIQVDKSECNFSLLFFDIQLNGMNVW